jgi:hypothetical protein
MVVHPSGSALQSLRQKDQEFKANLGHKVSSRQAWAI